MAGTPQNNKHACVSKGNFAGAPLSGRFTGKHHLLFIAINTGNKDICRGLILHYFVYFNLDFGHILGIFSAFMDGISDNLGQF